MDKPRVPEDVGARCTFEVVHHAVPFEAVTAVAVIAVTGTGEIVAITQARGLDIPGGHVQVHETSVDQVARREALEEAAILLDHIELVAYLRSTHRSQLGAETYIAIVSARVDEMLPFISTATVIQRRLMTPHEFLANYSAGNRGNMRRLVELAFRSAFAE